MGDVYGVVKVAAVQAASVFLDREGSTEKACRLIREAGRNGARVIGFPEGFIPAHPVWYHHHAATGALSNRLATELFKNAVEIPGPETAALSEAARDAKAYVVMGVCEKMPNTLGTMFNTQIYFGPDGALIGKHQKIMPTVGERLVHTGGYGDTFGAFQTEFGPMSGLICGENSNPLAVFALTAEGTRIHVMSWPNHFPVSGDPLRDRVAIDARSFAQMSKAFVIAACGTVDERMVEMLKGGPDTETFLRDPDSCGGSCIVAPNSRVIAGPMGAEALLGAWHQRDRRDIAFEAQRNDEWAACRPQDGQRRWPPQHLREQPTPASPPPSGIGGRVSSPMAWRLQISRRSRARSRRGTTGAGPGRRARPCTRRWGGKRLPTGSF